VKNVFGIECTGTENNSVRHFTICDVIFQKLMKGIIPGTAPNKQVPLEILKSPKSVKLAFLKGLFESDGFFGPNKNTLFITSKNLSYGVYSILISLGCIATVSKRKTDSSVLENGQIIKGGTVYPLEVSSASKDRLMSLWECGEGPEVTSGKSGFFWKNDYFATRVCAVEEVEEDSYIDFKIAEDTTFCTPGTATKNSIMIEHVVPLRVVFPQTTSPSADVYSMVNLSQWRDKIEQEILRWRLDNNYIPILPIPIGMQTIGGDGRALMLSQEYRVWCEQLIVGMGLPVELIWGGMSFSSSNVALRMLENQFLSMRSQRKQFIQDFLMPRVAAFLGWEQIPVHSKKFKMADDLQRSAFFLQLNQAGKISDKTLLEDTDWDSIKESDLIAHEQKRVLEQQRSQALSQAGIQGEAQIVMGKYQARAQKASMALMTPEQQQTGMPAPEQPAPGGMMGAVSPMAQGQMMNQQMGQMNQMGMVQPIEIPPQQQALEEAQSPLNAGQQSASVSIEGLAQQTASWLNKLPDHEKQRELVQMQQHNPQLYSLVLQILQQTDGAERSSAGMPLPENKPPRRGPEAASV
jgi:hypothetical protein